MALSHIYIIFPHQALVFFLPLLWISFFLPNGLHSTFRVWTCGILI